MVKQRRPESRPAPREPSSQTGVTLVLTGAVCLAIGLGIGYYFGRQAGPASWSSAPAPSSTPASTSGTVANPAAFLETEAALKASLAANPKDAATLVQLGNLYYDHGRFKDAVDWYGRALEIDPNNVNVRTDRGTSYWNIGQPDAAIAEFNRSLQNDPSHAQTLYNLGVVYLNGKNDPANARKAWEKLLATNPNYPDRSKLQQQIAQLAAPAAGSTEGVEQLLDRLNKK